MKEHPILFSAPMVRAILEGRKTQTRRVVKPQPTFDRRGVTAAGWAERDGLWMFPNVAPEVRIRCPYGQPGDRLWVRETTHRRPMLNILTGEPLAPKYDGGAYSADDQDVLTPDDFDICWWYSRKVCPAIHMPRWASRIDLEVTGVRVERLQDISEDDARAEGYAQHGDAVDQMAPSSWFSGLWESINGPGSWDANPWVWVVEFRRVKP